MSIDCRVVVLSATLLLTTWPGPAPLVRPLTASQASSPPIYVYISGGGGAQLVQIQQRIEHLEWFYEKSSMGYVAQVKGFYPDEPTTLFNLPFMSYSASKINEIVTYLRDNQGPNLHIMMSSMGAGKFRDDILPSLLSGGSTFRAGSVVAVETMHPALNPSFTLPNDFQFDLFVSIETPYTGAFSSVFTGLTGAGALVPENCTPSNCFFIRTNEGIEIRSPLDFSSAIQLHGTAVGAGENLGENVANSLIRNGLANVTSVLSNIQMNQPNVPVPFEASGPAGSGGSSGGVTGAGGGASGGGVGVESYPIWISLEQHRRHVPPILTRRRHVKSDGIEQGSRKVGSHE